MLTCLDCLAMRQIVHKGEFTGIDGRRVQHGTVICATKGKTGIVKMIDCREPGAAVDANAEAK